MVGEGEWESSQNRAFAVTCAETLGYRRVTELNLEAVVKIVDDILFSLIFYPPTERFRGYSDHPGIRLSVRPSVCR